MIRTATPADLPEVVALVKEFKESSSYDRPVTEAEYTAAMSAILEPKPEEQIVLVLDLPDIGIVGLLAGVATQGPHIYSGYKIATELGWFVTPAHRKGTGAIRLIRAFEKWAKLVGCGDVCMTNLADPQMKRITKIYNKLGYDLKEQVFVKEI